MMTIEFQLSHTLWKILCKRSIFIRSNFHCDKIRFVHAYIMLKKTTKCTAFGAQENSLLPCINAVFKSFAPRSFTKTWCLGRLNVCGFSTWSNNIINLTLLFLPPDFVQKTFTVRHSSAPPPPTHTSLRKLFNFKTTLFPIRHCKIP